MNHFLIVLIIGSLILFSGCTGPVSPDVNNADENHTDVDINITIPPVDSNTDDELNDDEDVVVEPPIEENPGLELMDPALTYSGSYNGPLYATSEQFGKYPNKDQYVANLTRNGVNFIIGLFPILGKTTPETFVSGANLGYAAEFVSKYPGRVVPFFGSGIRGEELKGFVSSNNSAWINLYEEVLDAQSPFVGTDFLRGFGEVETQEWTVKYTDPSMIQLVTLAEKNNQNIFFHPTEGKLDQVGELVEQYPTTHFIIHMSRADMLKGKEKLVNLLKTHDNLFFSIGVSQILQHNQENVLYIYEDDETSSAETQFISFMGQKYNPMLVSAVNDYKPLVDAAPTKVMWGTDVDILYVFEPKAYDLIIHFSRDFIANVSDDNATQKGLAYENALRVFGEGVTWNENTPLIDSSNWPTCTEYMLEVVCDDCGDLPDGEGSMTAEELSAELCQNDCLTKQQCVEKADSE